MPEDTPQAEQTPVTETQDAPMPSAEQQTTEVVVETKQDGLPENASDRTKHEFEKLRSDLREERQRRETVEAAFRSMQPKQPAQGLAPIVDPDTGYLNESALAERDKMLIEAQQRATKAEQAVQKYYQDVEAREAYQAHPYADPNAKEFDPKLKQLASAIILRSMVAPEEFEGKQLSLKEAYDFLKTDTASAVAEAKKEGAQQAIEQLTPKEQAALEATGGPQRREVSGDLETLRFQTRRGNQDAIVARMRALKTQA